MKCNAQACEVPIVQVVVLIQTDSGMQWSDVIKYAPAIHYRVEINMEIVMEMTVLSHSAIFIQMETILRITQKNNCGQLSRSGNYVIIATGLLKTFVFSVWKYFGFHKDKISKTSKSKRFVCTALCLLPKLSAKSVRESDNAAAVNFISTLKLSQSLFEINVLWNSI